MARLQLSSKARTGFQKSETKRLRNEGRVPATLYGKDIESKSISIDEEEFMALLKVPGGRQSVIDLSLEDGGVEPVMLQEIQRTQIEKRVLHINFHKVNLNVATHATVPVALVGEPEGAKLGGILEQITSEIEVKALPDQMPKHINVDVTGLEVGDNIHVSDITMPEGVEALVPGDTVIAIIRIPAAARAESEAGTAEGEAEAEAAE